MDQYLKEKYLSKARFNRYLIATGNDVEKANVLYKENILLSQAFHPMLTQFEVFLRNSISIILTKYFSDNDWIMSQKLKFMSDPTLRKSGFYLLKSIKRSEKKLKLKGIPISSGKIISEQNFGFWLAFYLPHHYKLVSGKPIQVFRFKPHSVNRASIYAKLDAIREFRNRVNHCEPICFDGDNISCLKALEIRKELYDLIGWIEPDLLSFIMGIDNTLNIITRIK